MSKHKYDAHLSSPDEVEEQKLCLPKGCLVSTGRRQPKTRNEQEYANQMDYEKVKYRVTPIGIVHRAAPGKDETARIEIFAEYAEGLQDIEGFSHINVFYWLHQSEGYSLVVQPPFDTPRHGVFATRSPQRPNPLGFDVVELLQRKGRVLVVRGLDAVDGTPVVDIKPHIPSIDARPAARRGWLEDTEPR